MKKILISLLSIIFIISMISNVYAATGSITSGASSGTVVKGKTFTVTLAGTADSPIDGMYTKFTYDKNVLEITSATAGENYGNSSSEGEILVTNNSSTTSQNSATLYVITFKILDTANVDSTTISFSDSALHLNEEGTVKDTATSIDSVTVNIKSDDTTADNKDNKDDQNNVQEETKNNTTTPSNTNDSGNKSTGSSSSNTSKNATKKTTKLPQTGVESVSIIAIIALGAVGIASYVSYRKYKNI